MNIVKAYTYIHFSMSKYPIDHVYYFRFWVCLGYPIRLAVLMTSRPHMTDLWTHPPMTEITRSGHGDKVVGDCTGSLQVDVSPLSYTFTRQGPLRVLRELPSEDTSGVRPTSPAQYPAIQPRCRVWAPPPYA